MGQLYRILDYQNKKIISHLNAGEVCTLLNSIFPAYTSSFDVVTHGSQFVTCDFVQKDGQWVYEYQPRFVAEQS
jgi:hypothetical protein